MIKQFQRSELTLSSCQQTAIFIHHTFPFLILLSLDRRSGSLDRRSGNNRFLESYYNIACIAHLDLELNSLQIRQRQKEMKIELGIEIVVP